MHFWMTWFPVKMKGGLCALCKKDFPPEKTCRERKWRTVLMSDALRQESCEFTNSLKLQIERAGFKRLLDHPAAVGLWCDGLSVYCYCATYLNGQFHDIATHGVDNTLSVAVLAVLQDLLDDVVSKHVCHKLEGLRDELGVNNVEIGVGKLLESSLDHAGAVLVACKLNNVAPDHRTVPIPRLSSRQVQVVSELLHQRAMRHRRQARCRP